MRACPASWRCTSDRALLTARGPLRRTSRTPHRLGRRVSGSSERWVHISHVSLLSVAGLLLRQPSRWMNILNDV